MMDRDAIMKQWDRARKYIAEGGKASWPRDWFEALLDSFEEKQHEQNDPPQRPWIDGKEV